MIDALSIFWNKDYTATVQNTALKYIRIQLNISLFIINNVTVDVAENISKINQIAGNLIDVF